MKKSEIDNAPKGSIPNPEGGFCSTVFQQSWVTSKRLGSFFLHRCSCEDDLARQCVQVSLCVLEVGPARGCGCRLTSYYNEVVEVSCTRVPRSRKATEDGDGAAFASFAI